MASDYIRFGILGDFIMSDEFKMDNEILNNIKSNDFNILNFEAPIIKSGFSPQNKNYGLHQLSRKVDILEELKIKAVSLANNHIMDFGVNGLKETIDFLGKNNIGYFGAGGTLSESISHYAINHNGMQIRLYGGMYLNYNKDYALNKQAGVAPLKAYLTDSKIIKSRTHINILMPHWGQEFEKYPIPICIEYSKLLSEKFDIIAGSHPHCIQGFQTVNQTPVFYSLGNLSMPHKQYFGTKLNQYRPLCYNAFYVNFTISDSISFDVMPYSIQYDGCTVISNSDIDNKKIITEIDKISTPLHKTKIEYRKFYEKNKTRKLKFTPTGNDFYDNIMFPMNHIFLKTYLRFFAIITSIFEIIGLRKIIKKKFPSLLNKLLKIK